jgi:hypothetical protein
MRKNTGFVVAANIMALATIFWASVAATSADVVRAKSYTAVLATFTPTNALEPLW